MYKMLMINIIYMYCIQRRPKLKTFFLTIVLEGLEDKYNVQFSRGQYLLLYSITIVK